MNNIHKEANIILDAGCGEGITLEKLTKTYPNKDVWGIEIDKEKVAICRKHGLTVTEANLLQLNTPSETIDCCILAEVIEHFKFQDAILVIKEMYRILRKDGTLIVVFPNDFIFKITRIAALMFKEAFYNTGHLWQWTPGEMEKQLRSLGFRIIKITNIPFLIWPLSLHCIMVAHKPK
ncbi:MAG: class I SAM-dependent methyltransferase [Candidatus Omnitrophica bacterium]|nr:class I SAM-dependent methyltransferase [Candidatus Omnitrophota bacterium]